MRADTEKSLKTDANEPETRVKQTVSKSLGMKFRDVLRVTQQIQSDYKSTMQNKIKRQLKSADGSKTDEEIEELARDPEKAQEVL